MRLLLLRHAPTPDTGKRLSGRQPGLHITSEGARHAERAGAALTGYPVAAVYTSPVLRCRETARLAARAWEAKPVPLRGFTEVDYGEWTGRTLGSLRRTRLWSQLHAAPSRVRFPDGESIPEVQARAVAAAERLTARHPEDTVLVVSHADVIKLVLAHYLAMPLDSYQRLVVGPTSLSVVDLPGEAVPRVPVINCMAGA